MVYFLNTLPVIRVPSRVVGMLTEILTANRALRILFQPFFYTFSVKYVVAVQLSQVLMGYFFIFPSLIILDEMTLILTIWNIFLKIPIAYRTLFMIFQILLANLFYCNKFILIKKPLKILDWSLSFFVPLVLSIVQSSLSLLKLLL